MGPGRSAAKTSQKRSGRYGKYGKCGECVQVRPFVNTCRKGSGRYGKYGKPGALICFVFPGPCRGSRGHKKCRMFGTSLRSLLPLGGIPWSPGFLDSVRSCFSRFTLLRCGLPPVSFCWGFRGTASTSIFETPLHSLLAFLFCFSPGTAPLLLNILLHSTWGRACVCVCGTGSVWLSAARPRGTSVCRTKSPKPYCRFVSLSLVRFLFVGSKVKMSMLSNCF